MSSQLRIVNQHLRFPKVSLKEPSTSFYFYIGAEVDRLFVPLFLTTSSKKQALLEQAKRWCQQVKKEIDVISAVVFKARLIPPGRGKFIRLRKDKVHIARFDLVILIEAKTLATIVAIQESSTCQEVEFAIRNAAEHSHSFVATNVRHIGPVDHEKQGVFLFNYFFADRLAQNLAVWEYTAGWFEKETGLGNSTVLLPIDPQQSVYTIINHCRWDKLIDILPSLLLKPTFRSYVLDNFLANNVVAMPILYNIA